MPYLQHAQAFMSAASDYPLPSPERSAVFALALCPHYTGEILLYVGLQLLREAAAGGCAANA